MLQTMPPTVFTHLFEAKPKLRIGASLAKTWLLAGTALAVFNSLSFAQTLNQGGEEFEAVEGAQDVRVNADGSVSFSSPDGRRFKVAEGDWLLQDGQLFLRDEIFANLFNSAVPPTPNALLAGASSVAAVGALVAESNTPAASEPTPGNTAPIITSGSSLDLAVSSLAGGLAQVTASDDVAVTSITLSNSSLDEAGNAVFALNSDNQIVLTAEGKAHLDTLSLGDTLGLDITASDGQLSTTQTLTLTVTAADTTAPTFVNVDTAIDVPET